MKSTVAETSNQIDSNSFAHDYAHHQRLVEPRPDFIFQDVHLKWYEIHRPEVGLPTSLVEESRIFLDDEIRSGRLEIATEFGFAMLHLGDEPGSPNTFAMLFVCTWRHGNELWRTLYTRSLKTDDGYKRYDEVGHLGTFCVFELGPVWHEREAWSRFLCSSRDEAARNRYLSDKFAGLV